MGIKIKVILGLLANRISAVVATVAANASKLLKKTSKAHLKSAIHK